MRQSRFTDGQILAIIKQNEEGISVADLYREHGMSQGLFYKWLAKFGGMGASIMKWLKCFPPHFNRLETRAVNFRGGHA